MSNNFNATLVLNISQIAHIAKDPQFGQKLASAVQSSMFGGDTTVSYEGNVALTAVEVHKGDKVRLVAVGGDTGRDLGEAGPLSNMAPGSERPLFEAALDTYDLVVRNEPKERTPEEKAATAAKAKAAREAKASQGAPSASGEPSVN